LESDTSLFIEELAGDTVESVVYEEEDTHQVVTTQESNIFTDSEEIRNLTAKIVDENRSVADDLAVEARIDNDPAGYEQEDTIRRTIRDDEGVETLALDPDEILNTPTMRAERYRHEIDESGGFIVSDAEDEKDELFAGGALTSIRNLLLIALIGFPITAYLVWSPEQIKGFLSEVNHTVQAFLDSKPEPHPSTNSIEEKPSELSESTLEMRPNSIDKAKIEQEPIVLTDVDDLEPPDVEMDSAQEPDNEVLPSDVIQAGEDYIATQTKYQQIEVPDEQTPAIPSGVTESKFQIFFEDSNTEIPTEFEEMLNDLYIVLSLNNQAYLKIRGYTDPSDDPLLNMRLSLERAQTVSLYFIDRGIDQARIKIEGRSPTHYDTNRAKEVLEKHLGNRRVELILQDSSDY
jgi:outer membrane protein OmpA-like peptidoglycan-associated protein